MKPARTTFIIGVAMCVAGCGKVEGVEPLHGVADLDRIGTRSGQAIDGRPRQVLRGGEQQRVVQREAALAVLVQEARSGARAREEIQQFRPRRASASRRHVQRQATGPVRKT